LFSARGRPNPRERSLRLVSSALMAAALACSDDGGGESGPEPSFPADYAASYSQVRDCRNSGDHELNRIRVLVDADALEAYRDRSADFPVGSVVLKEEHGFADTDCTDTPVRWTVMRRLAAGSSPQTLDWYWQDVDAARRVTSENDSRCIGCHTGCGVPPEGYLGTCTVVGASDGAFP
jgi:cytochrome P460